MARLLIKMEGFENRSLNLRIGPNKIGRNPDCDFHIQHATVSSVHCELILSAEGVFIHDCGSTNGTFVDRESVKEAQLRAGQTVHLGEVELVVESTEVTISIPKFQQPAAQNKFPQAGVGSPVVMPGGALVCPRHHNALATYKCTQCSELMCGKCVRSVKRQGGEALFFCPVCNGRCGRINTEPQKKKTFMDTLRRTVKLPFAALLGQPTDKK